MISEEKPHLLFSAFAEVPGPGSLGTRVYQLVSVFSDDFDVDGITLKGKDLSHIQRLGTARMLRVPVEEKPFLERLSSFQRALQRQLTGDSYQLVYCADIFSAQIAAAFKESRGYALVVEVNDLPAESYTRGYPIDAPTPALKSSWKDIEKQALRAADVVIAPSRNAARILASYVDPRRVQILSRAVDLSVFHPAAAEVPTDGRPTVVVVGRRAIANERKAALDILSSLAERLPETRARLVFAGQSALGEDTVQHDLVSSGLVGRVDSVDIDSPVRLANVLMEATVVVVPTKAEAGLTPFAVPHRALEAMACRRATVVTGDALTFSETFVPGREAVVVEPGRPIEAANAVIRLLESPAERQAIALAGHARVSAQADLQKRMAEFAVIITAATGVRMTPRAPESTVRGEWSASGAYSPDGFQNLTSDGDPGLLGPSLGSESAAALHTAANEVAQGANGPHTEASTRHPPSRTMIVSHPPTSDASAPNDPPPSSAAAAPDDQAGDDWGGDTAIEPDGAFDSSEPSSEPARIVRPTFQALADDDDDDRAAARPAAENESSPLKPARPPPLPRRAALDAAQPVAAPLRAPPTIVVDDAVPPANPPSVVAVRPGSVESDPFLTTGPSARPEPVRPPTGVRPSLDKTARMGSGPATPATGKRTIANVPSGQTSTAEPWPANLGPLARAPLDDDPQPTELIEAPAELASDVLSAAGSHDPWAPDTVFDAVPLFLSGEKKPDVPDDRPSTHTAPDEKAPSGVQKGKTSASFLVDQIIIDPPSVAERERDDDASLDAIEKRARTIPKTATPLTSTPAGAMLPSIERASTEPHVAPAQPTATDSTAPVVSHALRSIGASDRTSAKGMRTPLADDEDLFSDAELPLGDDDPDMTLEDASLPSKPASSSSPKS